MFLRLRRLSRWLLLLTASYGIACFASPIDLFADSLVRLLGPAPFLLTVSSESPSGASGSSLLGPRKRYLSSRGLESCSRQYFTKDFIRFLAPGRFREIWLLRAWSPRWSQIAHFLQKYNVKPTSGCSRLRKQCKINICLLLMFRSICKINIWPLRP